MASFYKHRIARLLVGRTGLAAVLAFGLSQPVLAQDSGTLSRQAPSTASDMASMAHDAPMDEDWQNISSRALLSELTNLAQELDNQRKANMALENKVDLLIQRLNRMELALNNGGKVPVPPMSIGSSALPKSDDAAGTRALAPALDLTQKPLQSQEQAEPAPDMATGPVQKPQKDKGYLQQFFDTSKSVMRRVTDW